MATLDNTDELSPRDLAIRAVYEMDKEEKWGSHAFGEAQNRGAVLKAVDAIPRVLGTHVPEAAKKRFEYEHPIFHVGQEHYEDRCDLCRKEPMFRRQNSIQFVVKEEPNDDPVVAESGGTRRWGRSFLWASINELGKRYSLGGYSKQEYRDYAYDCAVRSLGLDLHRLKFPEKLPDIITESVAKIIKANVAKWIKKGPK